MIGRPAAFGIVLLGLAAIGLAVWRWVRRARPVRPDGGYGLPQIGGEHAEGRATGLVRWLTTVNHKDIGILYLTFGTVAALWGGMDAMMMRTQLLTPAADVWSPTTYNALFTTHGITMLFLFVTPTFFGITNYFLPMMIGADDMAFPRLNAVGFWLLPPALLLVRGGLITELIGKALALVIPMSQLHVLFALQPPAIGWTMYTPLSNVSVNPQVNFFLLGLHLSGISTTIGAINFIATIVTGRADDVGWSDLNIFTWSMLTTSMLILFVFPILGSAIIMLLLDRTVGTTFFTNPGGGPLLWQHLFWFFGHPEVYIIFLPATGLMSTILPKFSGRKLFGFKFVVYSTLAMGVLSFGVWGHHMFTTGLDPRIRSSFMIVSLAIAVPSAIKTFNWITTMWKGRIRLTAPMLLSVGGIGLFIVGGVTGVFLASVPIDITYQGTYYVVGHFHLILMGVIPFMMFAASYYWFPIVFGRMYDRRLAKIQAVLLVVGSLVTFTTLVVIGMLGMPRRFATYPPQFAVYQQIASVGAYVIGLSVLLWLFVMAKSIVAGPEVRDPDVWDLKRTGQFTREWQAFEDELVERLGITPTEPDPEDLQPAAIEDVEGGDVEGAPTVLEDLETFALDLLVGGVGGAVGTGLLAAVLFVGGAVGVFDVAALANLGDLFFGHSVTTGWLLFTIVGMTVWPLVFVSLVDFLPLEANVAIGTVFGTIVAPGFAIAFYAGQSGMVLLGYLVMVLVGHWLYGAGLAATFDLLSDRIKHSLGEGVR